MRNLEVVPEGPHYHLVDRSSVVCRPRHGIWRLEAMADRRAGGCAWSGKLGKSARTHLTAAQREPHCSTRGLEARYIPEADSTIGAELGFFFFFKLTL